MPDQRMSSCKCKPKLFKWTITALPYILDMVQIIQATYLINKKIKTTDSFNCGWELIKFFSRTTHEKAPLARGFIKTTSVINFVVCMCSYSS